MKGFKKLTGGLLSVTMLMSAFSGIYVNAAESDIVIAKGWYESCYAEWSNENDEANAKVEYKNVNDSVYTLVDEELVRNAENGNGRVDIVGLTPGNYNIKITTSSGTVLEDIVKVVAYDRSGYAHFNNEGVGAYNDDGTLKAGAQVLYVTNENKNDVTLGKYTGIGNILSNANQFSTPIAVRIIGKVDTASRDSDGNKTTDLNNGVVEINGLKDEVLTNDSYFNMLDLTAAKNITIEGIGEGATIEKWGLNFKKESMNCEVRNLTFTKYPEDACSIEGSDATRTKTKYFWIHNNVFNVGENKYDLTTEKDKGEGDGSLDIKRCENVTVAYNQFNGVHKTSLVGSGDSVIQYNITYNHNYFNNSKSRMPLVRQANVHTYNNYFNGTTSACIDARANAVVLSEGNYFENAKNTYRISESSTDGNPVIKVVGDFVDSGSKFTDSSYILDDLKREDTYTVDSNTNKYKNFDTDSAVFYYDQTNKKSDVMYLTDAEKAKSDVLEYSGVMKNGANVLNLTNVPDVTTTTTESTTETTTATTTESTTETTTATTTESTTETTTATTTESTTETTTATTTESTTETTTVTTTESTTETTTATTTESTTVSATTTTETTTESTTEDTTNGNDDPSEISLIFGDSNRDGQLDIKDITALLNYVLTGEEVEMMKEESYMLYLDVNKDGYINTADVTIMLQKVLDSEYLMPCEK